MKKISLLITLIITFTAVITFADTPKLINYQGKLTDAGGAPITGSHTLYFMVFNSATGGSSLWGPQEFQNVAFTDGHFNVILGDNNISSAFSVFNWDP